MKKTSTVLISLILLSTLSILSANLVSATVGVANFLPGTYIPDEDDGPDTPEEVTLSQSTYNYITSAMYNKYPGDVAFAVNFTYSTYLSTLSTLQSYYDDIIVFSKGHRGYPAWPATNHISLLDYNRVGLPDDAGYYNNTDIYSVTSSKNLITFIWHCETALQYPNGSSGDAIGYYGMPYCWTHNSNLQAYSTGGDQVYLGWTNQVPDPPYPEQRGGSPQYTYEIVPDTYNYANVAGSFWYYMCEGDTVFQALTHLANDIYRTSFYQTDLYGWLYVWGNADLSLP